MSLPAAGVGLELALRRRLSLLFVCLDFCLELGRATPSVSVSDLGAGVGLELALRRKLSLLEVCLDFCLEFDRALSSANVSVTDVT